MARRTTMFQVEGMSCGHCVNAVRSEVGRVPGVEGVDVDLASGEVAVTADESVDREAVASAVRTAGYEVVA